MVIEFLMSPTRSGLLFETGLTNTGAWSVSRQGPGLTGGRTQKWETDV